jgi:hypothetical protein
MIGATFNDDAVRQYLVGIAVRADAAIRVGAADVTERLRAVADRNLSGSVLKSRTGTLRAALAVGPSAAGLGGVVRDTASYAAFQEYGFAGTETVRAHLRRRRKAAGSAPVRAFSRRVDYPAHSFLRSALKEMAPDIRQAIADAVAGAIKP